MEAMLEKMSKELQYSSKLLQLYKKTVFSKSQIWK